MTREGAGRFEIDLDTDEATESVKPNSTITRRQKELLNQMANSRFASRSEALRAAIEMLRERLEGDGTQPIDELRLDVQSLESELEELAEKIEIIHSALIKSQANLSMTNSSSTSRESQSAEQGKINESSDKLANLVHRSVLEVDIPTIENIADHCGKSSREVHMGLSQLKQSGLIVGSENGEVVEYRPASMEV